MSGEVASQKEEKNDAMLSESLWAGESEDGRCCRVCHGEAEENRPLFHPCRCDGSIKFVHQDCLQMWLKVSKQARPKCELCGEHFHFRNIYTSGKEGKPPRLSIVEFLDGLYPKIANFVDVLFRLLVASSLWVIILPLFTSWCLELSWSLALGNGIMRLFTSDVVWSLLRNFGATWWLGILSTAVIMFVSAALYQIGVAIHQEYKRIKAVAQLTRLDRTTRALQQRLADLETRIRTQVVEDNLPEDADGSEAAVAAGGRDTRMGIDDDNHDGEDTGERDREGEEEDGLIREEEEGEDKAGTSPPNCNAEHTEVLNELIPKSLVAASDNFVMDDSVPGSNIAGSFVVHDEPPDEEGSQPQVLSRVSQGVRDDDEEDTDDDDDDISLSPFEDRNADAEGSVDGDYDQDSGFQAASVTADAELEATNPSGSDIRDVNMMMSAEEVRDDGRDDDATRNAKDSEPRVDADTEEGADVAVAGDGRDNGNDTAHENANHAAVGDIVDDAVREAPAIEAMAGADVDHTGEIRAAFNRTIQAARDLEDLRREVINNVDRGAQAAAVAAVAAARRGAGGGGGFIMGLEEIQGILQRLLNQVDIAEGLARDRDAMVAQRDRIDVVNNAARAPRGGVGLINPVPVGNDGVAGAGAGALNADAGAQVQGQAQGILNDLSALVGPVDATVKSWATCTAFILAFLVVFFIVPVIMGRSMLSLTGVPPDFESLIRGYLTRMLEGHKEIIREMEPHFSVPLTVDMLWKRVLVAFELSLGLSTLITTAVAGAVGVFFLTHDHDLPVVELLSEQARVYSGTLKKWTVAIFKLGIIMLFILAIIPQALGWATGMVTLRAFDTTAAERFELCSSFPVGCVVIHWFVGMLLFLHIEVVLNELRDIIRWDLLVGILPNHHLIPDGNPANMDETSFELAMNVSYSHLLKRLVVQICFYIPGVLFTAFIPTRFGHIFCPFSSPLKLHFNEVVVDVQLPLETLVFHILIPLAIERMHHRAGVRQVLESFMVSGCEFLGLDAILSPTVRAAAIINRINVPEFPQDPRAHVQFVPAPLPVPPLPQPQAEDRQPAPVHNVEVAAPPQEEAAALGAPANVGNNAVANMISAAERSQESVDEGAMASAAAASSSAATPSSRGNDADRVGTVMHGIRSDHLPARATHGTSDWSSQRSDIVSSESQDADSVGISAAGGGRSTLSGGREHVVFSPSQSVEDNANMQQRSFDEEDGTWSGTYDDDGGYVGSDTATDTATIDYSVTSSMLMEVGSSTSHYHGEEYATASAAPLSRRASLRSIMSDGAAAFSVDGSSAAGDEDPAEVGYTGLGRFGALRGQPDLRAHRIIEAEREDDEESEGRGDEGKSDHSHDGHFHGMGTESVTSATDNTSTTIAAGENNEEVQSNQDVLDAELAAHEHDEHDEEAENDADVQLHPDVGADEEEEVEPLMDRLQTAIQRLPYSIRCGFLVFAGLLLHAFIVSWAIHLPLYMGREILRLLRFKINNDLYHISLGLAACWGMSYLLRYILRDVMRNANFVSIAQATAVWGAVSIKVLVLGTYWLTVPPLLIGLLFEAILDAPLRTAADESPRFPFIQCWALGLVMLKVWTRCILVGGLGDNIWRRRFERVMNRGFAQIEALYIIREIFIPTTIFLLDLLLPPYFVARFLSFFWESYATQTMLVRYSYALHLGLHVVAHFAHYAYSFLVSLHNEIRDSRYLVGTELANR